jgi:hypothetical protein
MEQALAACAAAEDWTAEDARQWRSVHDDAPRAPAGEPPGSEAETMAVDLATI